MVSQDSHPPRIALVVGDFPPIISGIGDYAEKLAAAVHTLGGDVTVITTKVPDTLTDKPYKVRPVIDSWTWSNRHQVLGVLREYDVAHIQYPSGAYGRNLMINLLPRLIKKHCPNSRSLVTIHDFRVMRRRWRARVAPMLWSVDGLIHVDPKDGPYLRSWMPFRCPPTAVIPIAANAEPVACTPADRANWRGKLGFTPEETVVAFFGVLYPHKGLTELLAAINSLREKNRPVRLLALGDFDRDADYVAPITMELQSPGVIWIKGATLERVSECLHAADLAALPFHSGTSTNRGSMLATLAHGLPTVTTDGPCTPADLKKTFDVSLVPVQSASALENALAELIDKPQLRTRMRNNALSTMATMSWPTVAASTMAFYERVLGRDAAGVTAEPTPGGESLVAGSSGGDSSAGDSSAGDSLGNDASNRNSLTNDAASPVDADLSAGQSPADRSKKQKSQRSTAA